MGTAQEQDPVSCIVIYFHARGGYHQKLRGPSVLPSQTSSGLRSCDSQRLEARVMGKLGGACMEVGDFSLALEAFRCMDKVIESWNCFEVVVFTLL